MEINKLYQGLTYDQYAAEPGVRSGNLKHMLLSPAHYKANLEKPETEESDALRLGKYIHSMLENGEEFLARLTIEPVFSGKTQDGKESTRSKEAIEKKKAWYDQLPPGAIVVDQKELDMLTGIAKNVRDHKIIKRMISGGQRETSLWVKDPETGLTLQCRPDLVDQFGFLVDFKTSARPLYDKSISNMVFTENGFFYAFQMAFYVHCLKIAGVCKSDSATIVFIERNPPYGIKIKSMDTGHLDYGHQRMRQCLRQLAEALETDTWKNYPEAAETMELPGWLKYINETEEYE